MNEYIRSRIRADAELTVQLARSQSAIPHKGMRGRFRELLVQKLIQPWLPPYAHCGTGTIIDVENRSRESTQEDIVIYDRSLMPSVLLTESASEGIFPLNAVLVRIEVKSFLTGTGLRRAVQAATEIQYMQFGGRVGSTSTLPLSILFAFGSNLQPDKGLDGEFRRLMDVCREQNLLFSPPCTNLPGPIGALCVVGRGCWAYGNAGNNSAWYRAVPTENRPLEELLFFVGALSNTCFDTHAKRQGRDPLLAVEGGIGNFILSFDTYSKVDPA